MKYAIIVVILSQVVYIVVKRTVLSVEHALNMNHNYTKIKNVKKYEFKRKFGKICI